MAGERTRFGTSRGGNRRPFGKDSARARGSRPIRRANSTLTCWGHGYEVESLFPAIRDSKEALAFFADRRIRWWTSASSGDRTPDAFFAGPTRNLASSQVSCVNFLLPLVSVQKGLVELLRAIDESVAERGYGQNRLSVGVVLVLRAERPARRSRSSARSSYPVTRGARSGPDSKTWNLPFVF
jgi:hypothetical protein